MRKMKDFFFCDAECFKAQRESNVALRMGYEDAWNLHKIYKIWDGDVSWLKIDWIIKLPWVYVSSSHSH